MSDEGAGKRERGVKYYKDITMKGFEGDLSEQVRGGEKQSEL